MFELSVLPLVGDVHLAESLRLVREAESALRTADHRGVLAKCREALESAAKYSVHGDQISQGFVALLANAFPESERKREVLDGFIRAFSEYAHLGRHAQYPALHITRAEAEFTLTTTLSFFSLLSRRLAMRESVG